MRGLQHVRRKKKGDGTDEAELVLFLALTRYFAIFFYSRYAPSTAYLIFLCCVVIVQWRTLLHNKVGEGFIMLSDITCYLLFSKC